MFQFAYNRVERVAGNAVMFTDQDKMHAVPPMRFVQGLGADNEWEDSLLSRMEIRHVSDLQDLHEKIANIHMSETPIHTLIVDDLDKICKMQSPSNFSSTYDQKQNEKVATALILAVMRDACKGLARKFNQNVQSCVGMSGSKSDLHGISLRTRLWVGSYVCLDCRESDRPTVREYIAFEGQDASADQVNLNVRRDHIVYSLDHEQNLIRF
jgi:hypothetical protein